MKFCKILSCSKEINDDSFGDACEECLLKVREEYMLIKLQAQVSRTRNENTKEA